MSGHSKWAQIKRQKGAADAKRGQLFTKLGREVSIAARDGGPDPTMNPRLRLAVQKAREANMPTENIERAIKRGSDRSDAGSLEEITYEGYGPGGAAILVEALTDNRNRAAAEVRNVFNRAGGSLGETGCVAWLFEQHGVITVDAKEVDPEEVALVAIDAGAEDFTVEDGALEIHTRPADLEPVRQELETRQVPVTSAELTMMAKTELALDEKDALSVLRLLDRLEELDDVQRVHTNVDFSNEVMEKFSAG